MRGCKGQEKSDMRRRRPKRMVSATILLEGLMALFLFGLVTEVVLVEVSRSQKRIMEQERQLEAYLLTHMALQTQRSTLTLNGKSVIIERHPQTIRAVVEGEEMLVVEAE